MANFYNRLSYSIGNEDWKTEKLALNIQPQDRILAITASGDRPLNLLFSDCKEIIAVDANPFQTALCDLKKAALLELDIEEYHAFLGIKKTKCRLKTLRRLEKIMDPATIACWRSHEKKIEKGILYEGMIEKLLQKASFVIRKTSGKKIERLFSFNNIDEQKAFMEREWNSTNWQALFSILMNPIFTRFFQDPGLYAHIDPSFKVSTYLYSRLEQSLKCFIAKENILVSLLFQGRVFEEGLSPYLTEEGMEIIKKRLSRLTCKTDNVISYLKSAPDHSIDCFSLSDIASYMSKADFDLMINEIYRVAKPGARFCIREFMSAYAFPSSVAPHFQRDHKLEAHLEKEDRCFVYRFKVGKIGLKGEK